MISLALLGCTDPLQTQLHGTVYASHDPRSAGLAAADVTIVDENGAELASATTDADGEFVVQVESGQSVFAVVTAQGYATSSFPGTVGIDAADEIEDHALYGVTLDELDGLRVAYAGCPGQGEGAVVFGEIRVFGIYDPESGLSPTTNRGTAVVERGKAQYWPGCYLRDDGSAYDQEADYTGATGRFAVFGVGAGVNDLVVQTDAGSGLETEDDYPLYVPDGPDTVSPWFPAFATFPGL